MVMASLFGRATPHSPEEAVAAATGARVRENRKLATSNKCMCFEQTNKFLNTTNVQRVVNDTQSKCLGSTQREAMVLIPSQLTPKVSEHTPLAEPNQQVSDVTPLIPLESNQQLPEKPLAEPTQLSILGLPVVHLSLPLGNPPWVQLSQKGILPMAETICQSSQAFAGRISLIGKP